MSFYDLIPSLIRPAFNQIRAVFRFLFFVGLVLCFFATAIVFKLITRNPIKQRQRLVQNANFYSKQILKAFNVTLICKENISESENSLIVGNHLGFIDIVCLQALRGSVFITSLEMKKTHFFNSIL